MHEIVQDLKRRETHGRQHAEFIRLLSPLSQERRLD